jgi:hypothetical protein
MFTRTRSRIEAAVPFPLIGIVRISDALGNRPDMNVTEINVPAVMAVVCGSAAGEVGGHTPSKRMLQRQANRPIDWAVSKKRGLQYRQPHALP